MTHQWHVFAPRGAAELRHGYTLEDLHRLARGVVGKAWGHGAHGGYDYLDRLEVVWSALAEALYASEHKPTTQELLRAGWQALSRHDASERHHHGMSPSSASAPGAGFGGSPGFQAYWRLDACTAPSPEDRVVEQVALAQIWPRLTERQREALLALAAFEDYAEAARALGIRYESFCGQVRNARIRFLALWHEGETPSRIWGRDRRIGRRDAGPPAEHRPVTVRMRAAAKRTHRATGPYAIPHGLTGYRVHGCRCEVCTEAKREDWRRQSRKRRSGSSDG
jgi:hypothetical protein